jgi:hypothetical protein
MPNIYTLKHVAHGLGRFFPPFPLRIPSDLLLDWDEDWFSSWIYLKVHAPKSAKPGLTKADWAASPMLRAVVAYKGEAERLHKLVKVEQRSTWGYFAVSVNNQDPQSFKASLHNSSIDPAKHVWVVKCGVGLAQLKTRTRSIWSRPVRKLGWEPDTFKGCLMLAFYNILPMSTTIPVFLKMPYSTANTSSMICRILLNQVVTLYFDRSEGGGNGKTLGGKHGPRRKETTAYRPKLYT